MELIWNKQDLIIISLQIRKKKIQLSSFFFFYIRETTVTKTNISPRDCKLFQKSN